MPRGIYKRNAKKSGARNVSQGRTAGALALAPSPERMTPVLMPADVAEMVKGSTPDQLRKLVMAGIRAGLAKL